MLLDSYSIDDSLPLVSAKSFRTYHFAHLRIVHLCYVSQKDCGSHSKNPFSDFAFVVSLPLRDPTCQPPFHCPNLHCLSFHRSHRPISSPNHSHAHSRVLNAPYLSKSLISFLTVAHPGSPPFSSGARSLYRIDQELRMKMTMTTETCMFICLKRLQCPCGALLHFLYHSVKLLTTKCLPLLMCCSLLYCVSHTIGTC